MIDKKEFESLLNDVTLLDADRVSKLKDMVKEFPYCQTLQILYLKNLQKNQNITFEKKISQIGTYVADRELLRNYLYPDGVSSRQNNYNEGEQIIESKGSEESVLIENIEDQNKQEKEEKTKEASIVDKLDEIEWLKNELSQLRNENEKIKLLITKNHQTHKKASDEEKRKIDSIDKEKKSTVKTKINSIKKEDQPKNSISITKDNPKDNPKEDENLTKSKLIEDFIKKEPSIVRNSNDFYDPSEVAKKSIQFNNDVVSETLAEIHVKQGNFSTAIEIYKQLSLKYPQKSSYFANQIQNLKENK